MRNKGQQRLFPDLGGSYSRASSGICMHDTETLPTYARGQNFFSVVCSASQKINNKELKPRDFGHTTFPH